MSFQRVVAFSLCAAALAAPLGAQGTTTTTSDTTVSRSMLSTAWPAFEVGVMGAYTGFDNLRAVGETEDLDDKFGYGAMINAYLAKHWALEFEVTGVQLDANKPGTSDKGWNTNLAGRVVANIGGSPRFLGLLGVGLVRQSFSPAIEGIFPYTDGVQGLVGVRFGLGRVVALRVDGVYNAAVFNGDAEDMNNWQGRAGLTFAVPRMYESVNTAVTTTNTVTRVDTVTVTQQVQTGTALPELRQAIFFEFNSDQLTDASRGVLDNTIVPALRNAQGVTAIAVGGFADRCGSVAYNDDLGYRRALAVADYLSTALPNVTVTALSAGKRQPLVETPNTYPGCRNDSNRRAEFFIDITTAEPTEAAPAPTTPPNEN